MGLRDFSKFPFLVERKKSSLAEVADFISAYGVSPREIDYESFVGLFLLRNRPITQSAYRVALGTSEAFNEEDISEDWLDSIAEDQFEKEKMRFEINAERAAVRTWRNSSKGVP